ncbi:hypothetical protein [Cytobacillus gottheilii]|uniref:hypothetical protein n=1 Tax=Cytobacillus gottheilii TaxID=859144 RepID=UPI001592DB37|nr:hypothetical protein [Cytobacillus gottheilii]
MKKLILKLTLAASLLFAGASAVSADEGKQSAENEVYSTFTTKQLDPGGGGS